jgi:hypothetical protein
MEYTTTSTVQIQVEVECHSISSSRRSKGSRRSSGSRRRRGVGRRGSSGLDEEANNPYVFAMQIAHSGGAECDDDVAACLFDQDGYVVPCSRPSKSKVASSTAYRPKSLFSSSSASGCGAPYRKSVSSQLPTTGPNKKLRKKPSLSGSGDDGNSSDSAAECGWRSFCAQSAARRRQDHIGGVGVAQPSGSILLTERRLSPMPSPSLLPSIELLPGATHVVDETDLCAFFLEGCS